MSYPIHRIRRQRWLLRTGSQAAAFRLRQRLYDEWQSLLLPAFEKVFDTQFGGEDVTYVTRIKLDLGRLTEEQLCELPALIYRQLLEQLQNCASSCVQANRQSAVSKSSTRRHNRLVTLFHYLRTGSLPWEAVRPADEMPKIAREMKQTCREEWDEVQRILRREQLPLPFYFRLLHLIGPAEAHRLAVLLDDNIPAKTALVELLTLLLELSQKASAPYRYLELAAWVLSETTTLPPKRPVDDVLASVMNEGGHFQEIIASLPRRARTLLHGALKLSGWPTGARANAKLASLTIEEFEVTPEVKKIKPEVKNSALLSAAGDAVAEKELVGVASEAPLPSSSPKLVEVALEVARPSSIQNPAEEFARMVTHAGLVLLHPFLPQLFETTRIREKGSSLLSWSALPHAAALLYYLATGQEEIYEYDIAFVKGLLGIEPGAALCVSQGLLTSDDRLEAETLLAAAIKHWQVLKNISIAAFRSSFLQRAGLLREDDNGWRLQVEHRPFDVLLEHLPWSISVVKLPWMKKPIHTEW